MKKYLFLFLLSSASMGYAQEAINPYISEYSEKYDYQLQEQKRAEAQAYEQWLVQQQQAQSNKDTMSPQKQALKDEADSLTKNMDDLQKDNPAQAVLAKQRLEGINQLIRFMN